VLYGGCQSNEGIAAYCEETVQPSDRNLDRESPLPVTRLALQAAEASLKALRASVKPSRMTVPRHDPSRSLLAQGDFSVLAIGETDRTRAH